MKGIMICFDEEEKEIKRVSLLKLPLTEEYIKKESINLYSEPEPCIIYRTTIINSFGINLLAKLKKLDIKNKAIKIDDLDDVIGQMINLPDEVKSVKLI